MRLWYDKTGRPWTIELDVDAMLRIRDATGLDLVANFGEQRALIWASDEAAPLAIYWSCQRQVERLKLTPEQFERLFDEDSLQAAKEALNAEVAAFFPPCLEHVLREQNMAIATTPI